MTARLPMIMLITLFTAAGCGGNKYERPGYAFGCPTGMEKKIQSKSDLIEAKVEKSGKVPNVEVVDLRCTERGDLLRIDVDLKNEDYEVRRVAYRFRWLDREGMRAWDDETWKPVLIYGNTLYTVTTRSPARDATDFRFMLLDQDKK
jgi:uncharacterized protein YcfL